MRDYCQYTCISRNDSSISRSIRKHCIYTERWGLAETIPTNTCLLYQWVFWGYLEEHWWFKGNYHWKPAPAWIPIQKKAFVWLSPVVIPTSHWQVFSGQTQHLFHVLLPTAKVTQLLPHLTNDPVLYVLPSLTAGCFLAYLHLGEIPIIIRKDPNWYHIKGDRYSGMPSKDVPLSNDFVLVHLPLYNEGSMQLSL